MSPPASPGQSPGGGPGGEVAPDEFVSEYSVPRIITQHQGLSGFQGLLLSTRDYPVSHENCLSLALMIMPSIMNFQPKQRKWCRFCQILKPTGGSFMIILIFET